ncbi:unnamed protein product [Ectocarpus sp. 13 AM-2016]
MANYTTFSRNFDMPYLMLFDVRAERGRPTCCQGSYTTGSIILISFLGTAVVRSEVQHARSIIRGGDWETTQSRGARVVTRLVAPPEDTRGTRESTLKTLGAQGSFLLTRDTTGSTILLFGRREKIMVHDPTQQFREASVFVNPRRRGGINYAVGSAEAKWAAEAATQPCREDTRACASVDQEAEVGAEMLRMMKMWSFSGGAGARAGQEAPVGKHS